MPAEALIDHYARAFIESAEAHGLSSSMLCSNNVPRGARFGDRELAEISRNAKLLMEDEFAGLTAHPLRPGSFAMMCEIAVLSKTLSDALHRAFRFYELMTEDVRFMLAQHDDQGIISMHVEDPSRDPHNVLPEWWLLFWQRFGQWLIGEEIPIFAVEFSHQPTVEPIAYLDVLGGNCRFGAATSQIRFSATMLDRQVVREVADLDRFMRPETVDLISMDGVDKGLAAAVRARLRAHLQHHQVMPKLEVLARDFGMCGQTLRRRLDAQGLSYRELKADVRREVAIRCLTDGDMPIREISLRAGFAEPNGLSRAIRSWAGVTPTHYREMVTTGQA